MVIHIPETLGVDIRSAVRAVAARAGIGSVHDHRRSYEIRHHRLRPLDRHVKIIVEICNGSIFIRLGAGIAFEYEPSPAAGSGNYRIEIIGVDGVFLVDDTGAPHPKRTLEIARIAQCLRKVALFQQIRSGDLIEGKPTVICMAHSERPAKAHRKIARRLDAVYVSAAGLVPAAKMAEHLPTAFGEGLPLFGGNPRRHPAVGKRVEGRIEIALEKFPGQTGRADLRLRIASRHDGRHGVHDKPALAAEASDLDAMFALGDIAHRFESAAVFDRHRPRIGSVDGNCALRCVKRDPNPMVGRDRELGFKAGFSIAFNQPTHKRIETLAIIKHGRRQYFGRSAFHGREKRRTLFFVDLSGSRNKERRAHRKLLFRSGGAIQGKRIKLVTRLRRLELLFDAFPFALGVVGQQERTFLRPSVIVDDKPRTVAGSGGAHLRAETVAPSRHEMDVALVERQRHRLGVDRHLRAFRGNIVGHLPAPVAPFGGETGTVFFENGIVEKVHIIRTKRSCRENCSQQSRQCQVHNYFVLSA